MALARALAPDPGLVLLDEPFNALDLDLRRSMCEDVIEVLRRTGTTTVLVTHDPGEAFAVSDRIAVMQQGRIMQCASPREVYWQPANQAVARLTGAALILPAQASAGHAACALGRIEMQPCAARLEGAVELMIRPEQLQWRATEGAIVARVVRLSFRGDHSLARLELATGLELDLRLASLDAPERGARGSVAVQGACMAWPAAGKAP